MSLTEFNDTYLPKTTDSPIDPYQSLPEDPYEFLSDPDIENELPPYLETDLGQAFQAGFILAGLQYGEYSKGPGREPIRQFKIDTTKPQIYQTWQHILAGVNLLDHTSANQRFSPNFQYVVTITQADKAYGIIEDLYDKAMNLYESLFPDNTSTPDFAATWGTFQEQKRAMLAGIFANGKGSMSVVSNSTERTILTKIRSKDPIIQEVVRATCVPDSLQRYPSDPDSSITAIFRGADAFNFAVMLNSVCSPLVYLRPEVLLLLNSNISSDKIAAMNYEDLRQAYLQLKGPFSRLNN